PRPYTSSLRDALPIYASRRRALLLTTLLGERGPQLMEQQLGLASATWAKVLLTRLPVATVKTVNRTLRHRMAKVVVTKGSTVLIGRLLPFGIGAVVGFVGSRAMGTNLVAGLREAFGPPPAAFPRAIGHSLAAAQLEGDLFSQAGGLIEARTQYGDADLPGRCRRTAPLSTYTAGYAGH